MTEGPTNGGNGGGKRRKEPSPGEAAFQRIVDLLAEDGWRAQRMGDSHVLRVHFTGRHASFACYVQVRVDLEQVLIYAVCPVRVPEEARSTMTEFVTRANYGMRIGNFELDLEDGELRFKTAVDFEGTQVTAPLLRGLIYPAVHTLDEYLPGILAVSHGEKTPIEAIRSVEEPEGD